jgi:hypothetical protein
MKMGKFYSQIVQQMKSEAFVKEKNKRNGRRFYGMFAGYF